MQFGYATFGDAYPNQSSSEVHDVQVKLIQLGYPLSPSGSYDPATSRAILAFREKMKLPVVDQIDGQLITSIEMMGRPEFKSAWENQGGATMDNTLLIGAGVGVAVLLAIAFAPR